MSVRTVSATTRGNRCRGDGIAAVTAQIMVDRAAPYMATLTIAIRSDTTTTTSLTCRAQDVRIIGEALLAAAKQLR